MVLMIWVVVLDLEGIPGWLEHMPAQADGMGFSDVIFPAFLVIVGLSIPFALDKPDGITIILGSGGSYPAPQSGLDPDGFSHVNLENMYADAMIIPKYVWQILLTVAFS